MNNLNPEQLDACVSTEGSLLILAGAGTGKTRVITQRIAYIINQGLAYPDQILAVTFTNKAANEMLTRIEVDTDSNGIWIGTFHSLSTRIIRANAHLLGFNKDFTIIDVDDQWRMLRKICKEKNLDEKSFNPKTVSGVIGKWKDLGLLPENLTASDTTTYSHKIIKTIYEEYQARLHQLSALDFGDLLLYCIQLFKSAPEVLSYYQEKFRYVLVDEYQDTNAIQYLWLRYLTQKNKNLCAVGDEDQSIYGWRGAEIRNILKFSHDFPGAKIIRLEKNYRSSKNILDTANKLIAHNKSRIGKTLWTDLDSIHKVKVLQHFNDIREAEFIAQKIVNIEKFIPRNEIAILLRTSSQAKIIEDIFIKEQIPYKIIGGMKFYDRAEIKNALAFIRLGFNNDDSLAFERVINVPRRGIGPSTIAQIQNYANLNQLSYFKATQDLLASNQFKGKTKENLIEFTQQCKKWNDFWILMSCSEACKTILNDSGYLASLKLEGSLEGELRLENIEDLLKDIEKFRDIREFIEYVSLVNDLDSEDKSDVIRIMTMHAAKGLEFSAVFLPGWEEGIFPSRKSSNDDELEEERRLAYVAITRAREQVYISYAKSRFLYGHVQYNYPSVFISEIIQLDSVHHISR